MLKRLPSKKCFTQVVALRQLVPASFQRVSSSLVPDYNEEKNKLLKQLEESRPKPYEGPERDLVNFPRRKRAIEAGKVRMGFLPDEWFTFFYKKTGVTGPYVFGTGLLTYLLSKEWYVMEEEFSTGVAIFTLIYIAVKKFGPQMKAYMVKGVADEEKFYEDGKQKYKESLENQISIIQKDVWRMEGQKILMDAKRENILMQLETEYRRRLMDVYQKTKKRLDYNLEVYNTKRKLEQAHMVDWIVNSVVKSITPEQEKEALKKCIEDLNALAVKA